MAISGMCGTAAKIEESFFELKCPVLNWTEGHILGNGDLGAVVWGHPGEVCIGLSKHDVNLLNPVRKNRKFLLSYREMVERLSHGDREFLKECWLPGCPAWEGPHQLSCGRLSLFLVREEYPASYRQILDWEKAECRIFTGMHKSYSRVLGIPAPGSMDVKIRVLADRNLVEIELSSETRHTVTLFYSGGYLDNPGLEEPVYGNGTMFRRLPEGVSFAVALDGAGEFVSSSAGLTGSVTFGGEAGNKLVHLAAVSSFDSETPLNAALKLLEGESVEMDRNHLKWWYDFWSKSDLSCSDKVVEELWRFGVYALGSSTRPDKSPPNLQGIWNQYRVPAWHCDFHFNANIQECHWLAGPSNHPEQEEALVRCMLFDWRENLRDTANVFGLPGLAFPLCSDWRGGALAYHILGFAMGMTAWMSMHLERFLRYGNGKKWNREILEFYRECCLFYLGVLQKEEDGRFHIKLSESPEQVEISADGKKTLIWGDDPCLDLAAIPILFRNYLRLSRELNHSDSCTALVAETLPLLAELPVKDGHWIDYRTAFFREGDAPGEFRWSHRHPSRLFPIFPGEDCSISRNLEFGRASFQEFRSYGEYGFSAWSYAWQAAIAARLGLGEAAESCLHTLCSKFSLGGGLFDHGSTDASEEGRIMPVFQMEASLGAAAAVNEMFLQGINGEIRVFPGVPENRSAAFRNLRIPGGFLISSEKTEADVLWIEIYSETDSSVVMINPWTRNQETLEFHSGEKKRFCKNGQ